MLKTAEDFAHQGFDPYKIAAEVMALPDASQRNLDEDLFKMIVLFYCRGANANRLKDQNTSRISDENTQRTATQLLDIYHVQSKPGRSTTTITLPRISLAFPAQSLKVLDGLIVVTPQKSGQAWLMEASVLPTIISETRE